MLYDKKHSNFHPIVVIGAKCIVIPNNETDFIDV